MATQTQIGALAFNAIVLAWLLVDYSVTRYRMHREAKQVASQGRIPIPLFLLRFWPRGLLSLEASDELGQVTLRKVSGTMAQRRAD